ncbi:MAG: 6-bladed beta-propeller [Bacteroidales bacterium]|nr:6-bladed beta-propeller [Bacteroidales bacterium]
MKHINLYIISLVFLFVSCNPQTGFEKMPEAADLKTLAIDPRLNIKLNYSQFIDSIVYIPLQTSENVLLGANVFKIIRAKQRYFVFDETKIVVFDLQGNYLIDFGIKGRGPGEMVWPTDFVVDSLQNTVEILSRGDWKINQYSLLTGEFIGEYRIGLRANNLYKRNPDRYIFYGEATNSSNKNVLNNLIFYSISDSMLSATLTVPLFLSSFRGNSNNSFSTVKDGVLFMRQLDNNIYCIGDDNEVEIKFRINYGDQNIPMEEDFFKKYKYLSDIMERTDYAVHFTGLYGNDSYLFFKFYLHNIDIITIYDLSNEILLYGDKVKNNIDSGPTCYVVGLYENNLIGTIDPLSFIKHFKTLKRYLGAEEWMKFISSHPNISKVLNSVSPQDNQILMLCYLKDKFRYEK